MIKELKVIQNLIEEKRYADASSLAIYLDLQAQTRVLFDGDKHMNTEKFDAFEMLLLADAATDFDVYNRFLDYRQPLQRNFYLDRRKYLKEINDIITNMFYPKDGVESYDVLRIKLRTRSGKSEVSNRAAFWVQGIIPSGETLHVVGGGRLKENIHSKREMFIDEYWDRHTMVFPNAKVERISKMDSGVWLNKKEYADIATVTVGGSIEGFVQVTNLLVLDDLVASNEINSVKKLEDIFENDILNAITRRIVGEPKIILIGTPIPTQTGIKDPLDRYYDNRKLAGYECVTVSIPSLDENGVSNYSYRKFKPNGTYEWDFTTKQFLREKKGAYASGNEVVISTYETIMQMKDPDFGDKRFSGVKTFNELPQGKYSEINVFDPADIGKDNAQFVHFRIYDSEPDAMYLVDTFRDSRPMDVVENGGYLNDLVDFMIKNDIHVFEYESNLGSNLLGNKIVDIGKTKDWRIEFTNYKQTKNKIQRILDSAMVVLEVVKVQDVPQNKMYEDSLIELRGWTEKSKHDDFVDAVTRAVEKFKSTSIKNDFVRMSRPIF